MDKYGNDKVLQLKKRYEQQTQLINGKEVEIMGISHTDEMSNWISVNLPENCPNVCISFKREIAEMQIKEFGAKPLYGLDREKEDWLPIKVFITYGGTLAPSQRCPEV